MIVDHRDAGVVLRRLAVPIAVALVADQLLVIADTIVTGSFGSAALAAITAASTIFAVFALAMSAFGSGIRIMGAQAAGGADDERFGAIVRAGALAPLAFAFVTALASFAFARPLSAVMLRSLPFHDAAAAYLVLRCCSLVPMAIDCALVPAFAAAGDTRLGLRLLIVLNIVHLPLLIVLALGLGTHHPFGIVGAGISSLIAEICGAAFCIYATMRRPAYRIFARWNVDLKLVRATTLLSLPDFIFLIVIIAPDPVTVGLLAPFGATAVAGFRALSLVSEVTWAIPGSLGDAAEIVLGQRLGARDIGAARAFRRSATRTSVVLCSVVALGVAILAWPLSALLTLSATLATAAAGPLAAHMLTLPLKGYAMSLLAPIRAAGDVRFAMVAGLVTGAIALSAIAVGILVLHWGLWAVPPAWILSWLARALLTQRRVASADWERRLLSA